MSRSQGDAQWGEDWHRKDIQKMYYYSLDLHIAVQNLSLIQQIYIGCITYITVFDGMVSAKGSVYSLNCSTCMQGEMVICVY